MNDVRAKVNDLVLVWLRTTWQECAEFVRLTGQQLIPCQTWELPICNTPQSFLASVWGDACSHEVVFRVDNEIGISPAELVEIIISLS